MDCWATRWVEEVEQEVHVDLAGEEGAGGRMDEEDALEKVEGRHEEKVVLAVGGFGEETLETGC